MTNDPRLYRQNLGYPKECRGDPLTRNEEQAFEYLIEPWNGPRLAWFAPRKWVIPPVYAEALQITVEPPPWPFDPDQSTTTVHGPTG